MKPRMHPLALLAAALTAGCSTTATRDIETARAQAHTSPLELQGPHNKSKATICTDGSVSIDKTAVTLDAAQRTATLAYRKAALDVVDLSLGDAAGLVRFAIPRLLFGMIIHGPDGAARNMEARANKIVHSPAFCASLETMRERQNAMVTEVAQLRPYVHLTPQDITDCRTGKPYDLSI